METGLRTASDRGTISRQSADTRSATRRTDARSSRSHILLIGDEPIKAMFEVKGVYSAEEGADPWVGVDAGRGCPDA